MAKVLDAFAKPPTLYYRGQSKIASVPGCVYTMVIAVLILIFFIHDLAALSEKQISQHKSVVVDSNYSFNPFFTENSHSGDVLSLSFGI